MCTARGIANISIDRIAADIGPANISDKMATNCFAPFDLNAFLNELKFPADIELEMKNRKLFRRWFMQSIRRPLTSALIH